MIWLVFAFVFQIHTKNCPPAREEKTFSALTDWREVPVWIEPAGDYLVGTRTDGVWVCVPNADHCLGKGGYGSLVMSYPSGKYISVGEEEYARVDALARKVSTFDQQKYPNLFLRPKVIREQADTSGQVKFWIVSDSNQIFEARFPRNGQDLGKGETKFLGDLCATVKTVGGKNAGKKKVDARKAQESKNQLLKAGREFIIQKTMHAWEGRDGNPEALQKAEDEFKEKMRLYEELLGEGEYQDFELSGTLSPDGNHTVLRSTADDSQYLATIDGTTCTVGEKLESFIRFPRLGPAKKGEKPMVLFRGVDNVDSIYNPKTKETHQLEMGALSSAPVFTADGRVFYFDLPSTPPKAVWLDPKQLGSSDGDCAKANSSRGAKKGAAR